MPDDRLAGDSRFREKIQEQVEYLSTRGWFHSIELPGGGVIKGLHSVEDLREKLNAFPIPGDLQGKRVLDVGAWTGWFTFELERRGAEVAAMDCVDLEEFRTARDLLGSQAKQLILDVEELSPNPPACSTTFCSSACSTTCAIRCSVWKESAPSRERRHSWNRTLPTVHPHWTTPAPRRTCSNSTKPRNSAARPTTGMARTRSACSPCAERRGLRECAWRA